MTAVCLSGHAPWKEAEPTGAEWTAFLQYGTSMMVNCLFIKRRGVKRMTQKMEKTLRARSAASQILFCCIPTNYGKSTASAITGERDGTEVIMKTVKSTVLTFSGMGRAMCSL